MSLTAFVLLLLGTVLLCPFSSSSVHCETVEQRLAALDAHFQPSLYAPILLTVRFSNWEAKSKQVNDDKVPLLSPSAIKVCYDPELNGTTIPLFSANATTFQVLTSYYVRSLALGKQEYSLSNSY